MGGKGDIMSEPTPKQRLASSLLTIALDRLRTQVSLMEFIKRVLSGDVSCAQAARDLMTVRPGLRITHRQDPVAGGENSWGGNSFALSEAEYKRVMSAIVRIDYEMRTGHTSATRDEWEAAERDLMRRARQLEPSPAASPDPDDEPDFDGFSLR